MPQATVEKTYAHRDAAKILEHAGPTSAPVHGTFAVSNGKVKPIHQAESIFGHPRTIRVVQENATPTSAFSSSEQFSTFILPSTEGPIEQLLLEIDFKVRHGTGSAKHVAVHPTYSLIDRIEVFLQNNNTADEIVSGEAMAIRRLFTTPDGERRLDGHEYGYGNSETGQERDDDLPAAVSLNSATDKTYKRTIELKCCLSHARLATAFLRSDIKIKVYWSGTVPATFASGTTGTEATLIGCDMLVVESQFDSNTAAEMSRLYNSSQGVHYGTIATTESEHVQSSGASGSEVVETLNQHTSYAAAALVYWRDTAVGASLTNLPSTGYKPFPFNVIHTGIDDTKVELEDENNRAVVQQQTALYQRVHPYMHCNFQGNRSDHLGFVWIPHSFDTQGAIALGQRTGGVAYSDAGKWKFKYQRGTAHNNVSTQTLVYTSFCYATLSVRDGTCHLERL